MSEQSKALIDNAARIVQFWPVVGVPVGIGLFVALFMQGQALREQNTLLEQDVSALHGQLVEVEQSVKDVDDELNGRHRAGRSGHGAPGGPAGAGAAKPGAAAGKAAARPANAAAGDDAARKQVARNAGGTSAGRARATANTADGRKARAPAAKAGGQQARKGARRGEEASATE